MARILTGIQSSGKPHLGNVLGAIVPSIKLSQNSDNESLFFIADLHSLINIKDSKLRKENTISVAAAWISMGFDYKNNYFYRQSKVQEVCELNWYLNCFTPFPMLSNSHSFKDKSNNLSSINSGLFTYPILMASDILCFDTQIVPVGKDQKQHLEITRDIADKFNKTYKNFFQLPEPIIDESLDLLTGTDGRKMSKSYNNSIELFSSEKILQKSINKIKTDSKEPGERKETKDSIIFQYFNHFSDEEEINEIKKEFEDGIGWGDAKKKLFTKINQEISPLRDKYFELIDNPKLIEDTLEAGETLAREEANKNLEQIKEKIGI